MYVSVIKSNTKGPNKYLSQIKATPHGVKLKCFLNRYGSTVDMVCAVRRKKAGKELRARGPSIVSAPKIVSHVYTLPSPRTRSHISLDFMVSLLPVSLVNICHVMQLSE